MFQDPHAKNFKEIIINLSGFQTEKVKKAKIILFKKFCAHLRDLELVLFAYDEKYPKGIDDEQLKKFRLVAFAMTEKFERDLGVEEEILNHHDRGAKDAQTMIRRNQEKELSIVVVNLDHMINTFASFESIDALIISIITHAHNARNFGQKLMGVIAGELP